MFKVISESVVQRLSDGVQFPADPANVDYQEFLRWRAEGNTPEPADQPTLEQIEADIAAEVQRRLEAWAQQREYDGIVSLCSYAGDPDPTLNAEGTLGVSMRSATWVAMKRIRAEVMAGVRPMPQTIADIEADLPVLVWPA
jgi:hypothetical protein